MVQLRKICLNDILKFSSVPQARSQIAIPTDNHEKTRIAYIVQSVSNNMCGRFVNRQWLLDNHEPIIKGNCIVLGVTLPAVSYQSEDFGGSQLIIARSKNGDWLNRYTGLYVATAISKFMYLFSYGKKPGIRIYKHLQIQLPVTSTGSLDTDYMTTYIKKIELDYIKKIEAYLSVLGYNSLEDCELSSQDLKVLSGPDEWGEFVLSGLFDHIEQGSRLKKSDQLPGDLPYVMSGTTNQGIANYISNNLNLMPSGSLTVDILGNVFYRSYQYGLSDDVGCYYDKRYSHKQMLYLTTAISKAMTGKYSYGKKFRSSQSSWIKIKLPVTPDGKPDYDFMDQYITAIEKKKVLKLKQAMDYKLELYREVSHQN